MEKIKVILNKFVKFIKDNPREFWILVIILALSAFLRLYKIGEYMTFLGDEGRDMIIVRRFLVEFHPPLIGPGTSVGSMYLGPLYYYMMAIPVLLANFSPVGPAVMVAILGVLTVFLIWFIGREWFGKIAGLVSALLYAISPTIIIFSRSSWNPNIMPFFSLLSIYAIWKVWKEKEYKWMIVLGISLAFVLQSHYLGLLLIPTLFIFWLMSPPPKYYSLFAISLFAFLMSPLLLFDIRHGWINLKAIEAFFTTNKDIGFSVSHYFSNVSSVLTMISANLISAKNIFLSFSTLALFLLVLIWVYKNKKIKTAIGLLVLWLVMGVFGIAFYKGPIYDHYLGFLFPAPFLILGAVAQNIIKNKVWGLIFGVYLLSLVFVNGVNSPVLSAPNMQMPRAITVARIIEEKANGERFNLATISDLNNRDVYKYFLMIWGDKVVDTDPSSTQFTVTDQLFVVCEKPREVCDPIHDPSAWITNFGWTKIVDEWEVWGGTLFKLGHVK